ncbi:hypothetical protein DSM00_2294 [Leeuwenhoekiella aequorea]|uniref:Uncharacterized protein n=2 Tax=Leeuwenhoekiella aequorea TaxID=283736 RepID=A0A4Q0P4F0_9FLAO|nr:hypothetical protein DSM00_2294 [Leeuwenhoekiella aequorea]
MTIINLYTMKNLGLLSILLVATLTFTSCREKTEKEKLVEEMKEDGAVIEETVDDDGDYKLKMESDTKEVKIKEDADGDSKIKVDNDN